MLQDTRSPGDLLTYQCSRVTTIGRYENRNTGRCEHLDPRQVVLGFPPATCVSWPHLLKKSDVQEDNRTRATLLFKLLICVLDFLVVKKYFC